MSSPVGYRNEDAETNRWNLPARIAVFTAAGFALGVVSSFVFWAILGGWGVDLTHMLSFGVSGGPVGFFVAFAERGPK